MFGKEDQEKPGHAEQVLAAAATAAVLNGYCKKDTDITVILKGGTLKIRYTDEAVDLNGDAVTVFSGDIII